MRARRTAQKKPGTPPVTEAVPGTVTHPSDSLNDTKPDRPGPTERRAAIAEEARTFPGGPVEMGRHIVRRLRRAGRIAGTSPAYLEHIIELCAESEDLPAETREGIREEARRALGAPEACDE